MMFVFVYNRQEQQAATLHHQTTMKRHEIRHFFSKQPENTKRFIVHFIFMKLQYFTA